ncbi:MAG: three-Cys-motif partner protein TcmP [Bryobacteraceae bacterium]
MTEHKFGGGWTEIKLSRLQKYLKAYRQIFTQNERAGYFKTWYVDAFAGTGSRVPTATALESVLFQDVYEDEETTQYRDGSATIALSLPEPFDNYLFIEKSKGRVGALQQTIEREHSALQPRCDFRQGDANEVLKAWCKERDWQKERAVVFLDPYGMQVEWSTVEALAATKAIDLWYLFPLGVGVARLLTYSGNIDEAWKNRLDLLFGTAEWRTEFYRITVARDLFGEDYETVQRDASAAKIEAFIHARLAQIFEKAAKGLVLRNSRSSPLYLLCFAAANKKGAPTAIRIAQDILDD